MVLLASRLNNSIDQADQALQVMKMSVSQQRRIEMQKRIDYYYGTKQLEYLDKLLKDQFKYPDRLKLQKEVFNVTEMIVDELAVLYNEEPFRKIIEGRKNAAGEDMDAEIYAEIVECSKLDSIMKTAQRLCKLCKTVLVRPVWRNESIQYDIITPNIFDVVQNPIDKTQALAILYSSVYDFNNLLNTQSSQDPFQNSQSMFFYWSDEAHFIFTAAMDPKSNKFIIEIMGDDNNPDNVNPYGVMPFVVMRDGIPIDQFFVEGGGDLINCNEITNVKLTEKNNLTKMQSFGQPVRKGATSTDTALTLDPSMTIDLPADTDVEKGSDFKFVSPDPKIAEMEDDVDKRIRRMASKYNLNPERFTISAQKSGADAMQIRALDQSKQVKANKPDWRLYEKELFKLTKIIWNYHNPDNQLSEDCELFVDFANVEIPMTQTEVDAHNVLMYSNGLKTKSQWLMEDNPNIRTEDEAKEMLEKVTIERAEEDKMRLDVMSGFVQKPTTPPPGNTPEDKMDDNMDDEMDPEDGDMMEEKPEDPAMK